MRLLLRVCALLFLCSHLAAGEEPVNLAANPGFEGTVTDGTPEGWTRVWSREQGAVQLTMDEKEKHGGARAVRIAHKGDKDWSFAHGPWLRVEAGDLMELGGWTKCDGMHDASLSVTTKDAQGKVLEWIYGAAQGGGTHDWQEVRRKFVIPKTCTQIQFRATGDGDGTVWLDDVFLKRIGNVADFRKALGDKTMELKNAQLTVRISPEDLTLSVTDARNGRTWSQRAFAANVIMRGVNAVSAQEVSLDLMDLTNDLAIKATVRLVPDQPEIGVTLAAEGKLSTPLSFPHPFVTERGTWLVVPLNEGILYPVDDPHVEPMWLVTYGGHGICMPWFGAADPQSGAGCMAIFETPDDARIEITRPPRWTAGCSYGRLLGKPRAASSPIARQLTYCFFDKGGYVAQAKRYREYAKKTGLFKTLTQKKTENPNVDLLIGAANIWNWDMDKAAFARK